MTRDAALIIAAQKVEHYEIATLWCGWCSGPNAGKTAGRRNCLTKR
jgi:ferritin-like metal-binding protein YciE